MPQFYDSSGKTGIVDDVLFQTNTNTTTYPLADITRNVNKGYAKVMSIIFKADGDWQYDDTNQTNMPVATTNLVANQADYQILAAAPTTGQDWLRVRRVEIADSNGKFNVVPSTDDTQEWESYSEIQKTPGVVSRYDMRGNSLVLLPPTNYDYTAGLKVYFDRGPLLFTSTDTTKQPGFASIFHPILSLWGQYYWFTAKDKTRAEQIMRDIVAMEKEIMDFYSRRPKYKVPILSRLKQLYK